MKYFILVVLFMLACLDIHADTHLSENQYIKATIATNEFLVSTREINIQGHSIDLYNLLLSFRSLDYIPQETDWQKARALIDAGAEVNLNTPHSFEKSFCWMTLLHFAVIHNNSEMVTYLLVHNAYVNTMDMGGDTPLHYAARYKRHEIAKILLDHGADRTILDDGMYTPLDFAQTEGYALDQHMASILQHYPGTTC